MQKSNPLVSLARRKGKKHKKPTRKGIVGFDEAEVKHMTSKQKAIQKAIDRKLALLGRQLKKEEGDFEELEVEEDDEAEVLEEILDKLDLIADKLGAKGDEEAAVDVDEEEEFPDADEVKAIIATVVKSEFARLRKEEMQHKPKVPESSVDTGEDEREVEEKEPKAEESHAGEEAEEERKMAKANYDNGGSKAKELPEKDQLKQKVVFQTTIPSESAEKRSTSKAAVKGKSMQVQGSFEKGTEGEVSPIYAVLHGEKAKKYVMGDNGNVFGGSF